MTHPSDEWVKEIVDECLEPMRKAIQLLEWRITPRYVTLDGCTVMRVTSTPCYRQAVIEIDSMKLDARAEVLRALRHELFHILHAEYAVAQDVTSKFTRRHSQDAVVHVAFQEAAERTVGAIERMFDHGLSIDPESLVARGKRLP